jgi:hypothetical protein
VKGNAICLVSPSGSLQPSVFVSEEKRPRYPRGACAVPCNGDNPSTHSSSAVQVLGGARQVKITKTEQALFHPSLQDEEP